MTQTCCFYVNILCEVNSFSVRWPVPKTKWLYPDDVRDADMMPLVRKCRRPGYIYGEDLTSYFLSSLLMMMMMMMFQAVSTTVLVSSSAEFLF